MSTAVSTTSLTVDYRTDAGTVHALRHSGFAVDGPTSVAIMGPSGCGKSTLLGLIAGLAVPTTGSVTVGETIVSDLDERGRTRFRRTELGMVYQAANLLPHLTVEENVAVPLALSGKGRHLIANGDATTRVLRRLGLSALGHRFPDQLSGGQRQRVAVARAIVHRPPVMLADEPTGALDAANAQAVIELLLEARAEIDATLILVTHDPAIAARADRVDVLTTGAAA